MAIVSDVEIRLRADIARLQQDMTAARRSVDTGMQGITRAASAAKAALGGIFAGLSIVAFGKQVLDAQREFDKLNASLVTATGSTSNAAQAFAALQKFAATTPYSVAEATDAFIKLRNLGLNPSEAALRSYGNTAAAMGKGLNQMIEAVADAATGQFERLKEFGVTAKQQGDQVFLTFQGLTKKIGNNSKEIQAYMRAIGDVNFNGAMEARAATLDGAISNLGDTWDALLRKVAANGVGEAMRAGTTQLGAALTDLGSILDAVAGKAANEGKAMSDAGVLHSALTTIFEALAVLGANVFYVLQQIANEIGGVAAQANAVLHGDFAEAAAIRKMMVQDGIDARKAIDAKSEAILNASTKAMAARDAEAANAKKNGSEELGRFEIVLTAQQKRDKADLDSLEIRNKLNGVNAQTAGDLVKLKTALDTGAISQKEYAKYTAQMTKETTMASTAYKDGAKVIDLSTEAVKRRAQAQAAASKAEQEMLDHMRAMGSITDDDYITRQANAEVKALNDQKAAMEAQQAILKKRYDTEAARAALTTQIEGKEQEIAAAKIKRDHALDELDDKRYRLAVEHTADRIDAAKEAALQQKAATRDMQDEVAALGMTAEQLAKVTAARKIDEAAALDRRASIGIIEEENDALRAQAEELRKQASLGLTKARVQEQQKFWGTIEQTAHDFFMSTGDANKSMWQRMKDSASSIFFEWLYQMTVKKWIINIGASIDGNGAVAALGGGGFSTTDLLSAGKKLYDGFSTGLASAGSGIASSIGQGLQALGNSVGNSTLSTFGQGMQGFGADGSIGGASGAGASMGAAVSTAATIAAGVLGGVYGGRLISGQYGRNGVVNGGTAAGAAIGTVILPGVGTAVGALVGGLVGGLGNRLFGMGDKNVSKTGLSGNFDIHGFDGETYSNWSQKGGLFRSNKSGTDHVGLDAATEKQFSDGFAALKATTVGFATSLGVTSNVLDSFSKKIDLTMTTDAAKNQEAIAKVFTDMADSLATYAVPSLAQFTKQGETASATLQRVATDFQAVDIVMAGIGRTFGQVGVGSIAARERLIELSGGMEAFASSAAYFQQNFYTDAEKVAAAQKPLQAALDSIGMSSLKTTAQFKDAVLALDLTTEQGAQQYATLMALAPQFKAVADYTASISAATAQAAADLASARSDLEEQLLDAQGDAAGLLAMQRARELAALDASLRPLKERIYALQDEKAATEAAAEAAAVAAEKAATLASARAELDMQLMDAQGDAAGVLAAQRAQELAALDESLRPLKERIYALQDEKAASEAATQAAAAAAAAMEQQRAANEQAMHGLVDAAMSAVTRAAAAQKTALNAAFDASMDSFSTSIDKVNDTIARTGVLSQALKGAMAAAPGDNGAAREQVARAQIMSALTIAKASGILPSAEDLADALAVANQDSSDNYSTLAEYQRAVAQTNNALESLGGLTGNQMDTAQLQLQALQDAKAAAEKQHDEDLTRLDDVVAAAQAQVDAINGVNNSVQSVAAAVAGLQVVLGALASAPTAAGGGLTGSGTTTVEQLYAQVLGRAGDAAGLSFWKNVFGDTVDRSEYMDFVKAAGPELQAAIYGPPSVTTASGSMSNSSAMVTELQTLNARMANVETAMQTTAAATGQFADQFHKVSAGGNALATEIV